MADKTQPYEKLERFTAVITADAMTEARDIYAAIQQESDQVLSAAEDEALAETFRYIKNEISRIRNTAGQRVSKKIMDDKRSLARRRSEMNEETLTLVREKLRGYVTTDAYKQQLKTLAAKAVELFQEDTQIYLRAEDLPLVEAIRPKCSVSITFHEGTFRLGGLRAVCPGKHLQIDESFDTELEELAGRFAELFGLQMAENSGAEKCVNPPEVTV